MNRVFSRCLLMAGIGLLLVSTVATAADYFSPSGQKLQGEMQGNRLFILVQGKRQAAPDGKYRTADGRFIIVQGGIVQRGFNPTGGFTSNAGTKSIGPKPDDPARGRGFEDLGLRPAPKNSTAR